MEALGWGIYDQGNKRVCICLGGIRSGNHFSRETGSKEKANFFSKKIHVYGYCYIYFKVWILGFHIVDLEVNP